ncbi:MAG: DNA-directed RNA polymerase subunit omega [Planctomycetota bacterium]
MIEALKSEELIGKTGGRFKLCVLIQRRLNELLDGARPLIERDGRSDLEVAIEEIAQDKITLQYTSEMSPEALPERASGPAPGQALL